MGSTVLQSLEETHTYLSPSALCSPVSRDTIGGDNELSADADDAGVDERPPGPLLVGQPLKLRHAQIHLLRRLALLILRPSAQELEDAKRFVAFFLFGSTNPQCLQPLVEQDEEHPDGLVYTAATGAQPSGTSPAAAAAAAAAVAEGISALITPRSARDTPI